MGQRVNALSAPSKYERNEVLDFTRRKKYIGHILYEPMARKNSFAR
jgi:hypothetical protein